MVLMSKECVGGLSSGVFEWDRVGTCRTTDGHLLFRSASDAAKLVTAVFTVDVALSSEGSSAQVDTSVVLRSTVCVGGLSRQ